MLTQEFIIMAIGNLLYASVTMLSVTNFSEHEQVFSNLVL